MIFGKLFKKDKEEEEKKVTPTGASAAHLLDDIPEEVTTGTPTNVEISEKTTKKSKKTKTNKALQNNRYKKKIKRIVHTKKSHHKAVHHAPKEQVNVYDIIERPVVTEKVAILSERGVYAFFVRKTATKHTVADAIEAQYNVRPVQVRIAKKPAKKRRIRIPGREREYGMTSQKKKAYVYLKKGDTIQLT